MASLQDALWFHDKHRVVFCFLCQSVWQEQMVGVGLVEESASLGSLCPRCLRRTPVENAGWLKDYGESLRRAICQLKESLPPFSVPKSDSRTIQEFQVETTRLLHVAARSSEAATGHGSAEFSERMAQVQSKMDWMWREVKRLTPICRRSASMDGQIAEPVSRMLSLEMNRTQNILSLAVRLSEIESWATTVNALIEAEIQCSVKQQRVQQSDPIRRAVEGRYRRFLLRSA